MRQLTQFEMEGWKEKESRGGRERKGGRVAMIPPGVGVRESLSSPTFEGSKGGCRVGEFLVILVIIMESGSLVKGVQDFVSRQERCKEIYCRRRKKEHLCIT